jgi:hypothetical protein
VSARKIHALAIAIADDTARSDVECFAAIEATVGKRGAHRYNLGSGVGSALELPLDDDGRTARRAAEYIDLRGEALSYRMHRDAKNPDVVWFEDKSRAARERAR